MNKEIIFGLIILATSGIFLMNATGQYWVNGLKGELASLESLGVQIASGGIGIFLGIILLAVGLRKKSFTQ